jgi:hypothetical protein
VLDSLVDDFVGRRHGSGVASLVRQLLARAHRSR